jgi:hypothetical protein
VKRKQRRPTPLRKSNGPGGNPGPKLCLLIHIAHSRLPGSDCMVSHTSVEHSEASEIKMTPVNNRDVAQTSLAWRWAAAVGIETAE